MEHKVSWFDPSPGLFERSPHVQLDKNQTPEHRGGDRNPFKTGFITRRQNKHASSAAGEELQQKRHVPKQKQENQGLIFMWE